MSKKIYSPRNLIRTAILVDGGFFIKRYKALYDEESYEDPKIIADNFYKMIMEHVKDEYLYRVIYYDCLPFSKKVNLPISGNTKDFSKDEYAKKKNYLFEELKKKRKVALRLGELKDGKKWIPYPRVLKKLKNGEISWSDLTDDDFYRDLKQKGVDIKIGVDIASLAIKRMVDKIILISGDSDFVPAAKLARREGIDFILDPMHNDVVPSLFEHIDGLKSTSPKPVNRKKK